MTGAEWSDENASGLKAYPALIRHFEEDFNPDLSWNMEYFLGTYGALKYYAWKYFEKMKETELATIYKAVFEAWQEAFRNKNQPGYKPVRSAGQDFYITEVGSMRMKFRLWTL